MRGRLRAAPLRIRPQVESVAAMAKARPRSGSSTARRRDQPVVGSRASHAYHRSRWVTISPTPSGDNGHSSRRIGDRDRRPPRGEPTRAHALPATVGAARRAGPRHERHGVLAGEPAPMRARGTPMARGAPARRTPRRRHRPGRLIPSTTPGPGRSTRSTRRSRRWRRVSRPASPRRREVALRRGNRPLRACTRPAGKAAPSVGARRALEDLGVGDRKAGEVLTTDNWLMRRHRGRRPAGTVGRSSSHEVIHSDDLGHGPDAKRPASGTSMGAAHSRRCMQARAGIRSATPPATAGGPRPAPPGTRRGGRAKPSQSPSSARRATRHVVSLRSVARTADSCAFAGVR